MTDPPLNLSLMAPMYNSERFVLLATCAPTHTDANSAPALLIPHMYPALCLKANMENQTWTLLAVDVLLWNVLKDFSSRVLQRSFVFITRRIRARTSVFWFCVSKQKVTSLLMPL